MMQQRKSKVLCGFIAELVGDVVWGASRRMFVSSGVNDSAARKGGRRV